MIPLQSQFGLKDRAESLVLNLNLGGLNALIVELLMEPASTMLELDARVQMVHSFGILPHINSELVKDAVIHEEGVAVQVVGIAVSPVEIEGDERSVDV